MFTADVSYDGTIWVPTQNQAPPFDVNFSGGGVTWTRLAAASGTAMTMTATTGSVQVIIPAMVTRTTRALVS